MKTLLLSIVLISTLSLAMAGTDLQSLDGKTPRIQQINDGATDLLLESQTPGSRAQAASIFGKSEADSMQAHEENFLAIANVGEVKVGAVGSNELIYILIVVLLVVVIIKVI